MCLRFTRRKKNRENGAKKSDKKTLVESEAKTSHGSKSAELLNSRNSAEIVSGRTEKDLSLDKTQTGSNEAKTRGNAASAKQGKKHSKKYCQDEEDPSNSSISEFEKHRPISRVALNEVIPTLRNDPTISGRDFTESTKGASAYRQNSSKTLSLKDPPPSVHVEQKGAENKQKRTMLYKKSETVELKEESARDESPQVSGSANVSFNSGNLSARLITQNSSSPNISTAKSPKDL